MKKILVIDDDDTLRSNTALYLQMSGFEIIVAENGAEGVRLARKNLPDLVICDITMPGMDGYAVIENLSKTPETAIIPFIFLTAKSEKEDFRMGMQLGADDYIAKPFNFDDLISAINIRLQKQEAIAKAGGEKYLAMHEKSGLPTEITIKLSNREKEVLCLIALGLTNNEIAEKLFISPRTVDFHRSNLLLKTESKNGVELVRFAIRHGLADA